MAIDYDALAKQHGAVSSEIDYDALAKQNGAITTDVLDDPNNKQIGTSNGIPVYQYSFAGKAPEGSALSRAASNFWDEVNPVNVVKGVYQTVAHPINTVSAIGQSHADALKKGVEEYNRGNYGEAARHFMLGVIPLLGPNVDARVDQAESGDVAGAIGGGLGMATGLLAPEAAAAGLRRLKVTVPPLVKSNLNPVEQATVQYLQREGVDTPLSFQTGNKTALNLEGSVQNEVGGAGYAAAAKEQTNQQMQALVQRKLNLANPVPVSPEQAGTAIRNTIDQDLHQTRANVSNRVSPKPVTPEQAGAGVMSDLEGRIQKLHQSAGGEYDLAWRAEKDPRNLRDVPMYDKDGGIIIDPETGKPETQKMALPVDMSELQDALAPVEAQYAYTLPETDIRASKGLKAMRNILNGPRFKPASQAERDLSMLKEAARSEKGMAELRDESQGLAALQVGELQKQIDGVMAQAHYPGYDPKAGGQSPALQHLQAGRKLTAQKYEVSDLRDTFGSPDRREPVGVFQQLTWGKDAGIDRLRQVAQIAGPNRMAEVGRAYIDSGGNWEALGKATKQELFRDPKLIADLDGYYAKQARLEPLTKLEPVQLVDRLTANRDTRINLLRDVEQQAPQQMPELGRAVMQGFVEEMTRAMGDFAKTKLVLEKWLDLGKETKQILYQHPGLIDDFDNTLRSLVRLSQNPNPSGSGYIISINRLKSDIARGIGTAVGGLAGFGVHGVEGGAVGLGLGFLGGAGLTVMSNAALARALYNPKFTALLRQGIQLQVQGGNKAALAATAAQLAKLAQEYERKDQK